jgi:hypothetical protein
MRPLRHAPPRARHRRRLTLALLTLILLPAAGLSGWAALRLGMPDRAEPVMALAPAAPEAAPAGIVVARRVFDPAPMTAPGATGFASSVPAFPGFQAALPVQSAALAPARQELPSESAPLAAETSVPMPVPRPPDFASLAPAPGASQQARTTAPERPARTRTAVAPPAEATADNRSFLDRLFGAPQEQAAAPRTRVAAAPSDGGLRDQPASRLAPAPIPVAKNGVAVYDISARTVYMPNGERLEAHSGLGDKRDDPRHVHVRMKGATPPGTYDLREREALFHGVRAIRMNPVGGSAAIFGRAGILAHHYLLGPGGDSNGCISFKDYDRFLQAFLRGEVRRIVVVPGRYQDGPRETPGIRIGMAMPGGA